MAISSVTASGRAVSLFYLQRPLANDRLTTTADWTESMVQNTTVLEGLPDLGPPPIVAIGDLYGDGESELVVGQGEVDGPGPRDMMEIYAIGSDHPPRQITQFAAYDNSPLFGSSNIAIGDVDVSVPGEEIVVADDDNAKRSARVRVFGDLANGAPRLLAEFRAPPRGRRATQQPPALALGDVFMDGEHPGLEIVLGNARGRVYVWGVQDGRRLHLQRFRAFPDSPSSSASHLAVGDLVPSNPGDEIVVADDGTRQDGTVRVFDGRLGRALAEFSAFAPGQAPAGVEVWTAPLLASFPGAELIVGQGAAGGLLRVFRFANGVPIRVMDLPDPRNRTTTLSGQLAVGRLFSDMPANQVAVVQSDPAVPLQIFRCDTDGSVVTESWPSPAGTGSTAAIGTVSIAR